MLRFCRQFRTASSYVLAECGHFRLDRFYPSSSIPICGAAAFSRVIARGVALFVFVGLLRCLAPAASLFSDVRWIIQDSYVDILLNLNSTDTATYLDQPLANIQGTPVPKTAAGLRGIPQAQITSYATLQRDLAAHAIEASSLPVLLYDNERWPKTPTEEQKNPRQYMELFTKLAHTHGFVTNMAPDQNLASPLVSGNAYQGGESRNWQAYLRMGLATGAAQTGTERFHVMSQPFESRWGPTPEGQFVGGEAEFVNYVTQATLQAKAVNPKLIITCGLSTNPRYNPTAEIMLQESVDVRHLVDGYWLNLWGNPMGASYFSLLAGPLPRPNSSVLFLHRSDTLNNRLPEHSPVSKFNLSVPGATLTFNNDQTFQGGTVIPAGAWEFQFWSDGDTGSAKLGLEFGYTESSGDRHPIIRAVNGWTPTIMAAALGAAEAKGAYTTTTATILPPGGPYQLYLAIVVIEPGHFNLLYDSASAPTNLATPFLQPLTNP